MLMGAGRTCWSCGPTAPTSPSRTSSPRRASNPGKLTYASQGNGTSAHLAGEMFTNLAKVQMTHVPYRGAGPAITDLLGGQVDVIFGTAAAVSPSSTAASCARSG